MPLVVYDLLGALFAPPAPLGSRHNDMLFMRVCRIIKNRFADPDMSPREVAAEAGISLRYLQKLFTVRGSTCSHHICSARLDHAARLIERRAVMKTGQPLSDIAYTCGFRDHTHFARGFRKRFGAAPGAVGAGATGNDSARVRAGCAAFASEPDSSPRVRLRFSELQVQLRVGGTCDVGNLSRVRRQLELTDDLKPTVDLLQQDNVDN